MIWSSYGEASGRREMIKPKQSANLDCVGPAGGGWGLHATTVSLRVDAPYHSDPSLLRPELRDKRTVTSWKITEPVREWAWRRWGR